MADGDGLTDPMSGMGGGDSGDSGTDQKQLETPTPTPEAETDPAPHAEAAEHTEQKYQPGASEADILGDMTKLRQQTERENQEYNKVAAPMYKKLLEMQNQPSGAGMQVPKAQDQQTTGTAQAIWQQNRHDLQKASIGYLAVAIPLAIAMGSRGGWAMSGALGGLGKGLTNVVNGYDEQADQALKIWQHQGTLGGQKFRDQMSTYKQIMANRKYNLKQMEEMIKTTGKLYGDKRIAEAKDYKEMKEELVQKEKLQEKYDKSMHDNTHDVLAKTGKTEVYKAWADEMEQDYKVDVYKKWDELDDTSKQIIHEHPFNKFWEAHRGSKKKAEATTTEEEKKTPSDADYDKMNKDLLGE